MLEELLIKFSNIEEHIKKEYKKDEKLKKLISEYKEILYVKVMQKPSAVNLGVQENNGQQRNMPGALINKKSVCYMNALIQALASSDVMIKKLQKLSERYPSNSSLSCLLVLLNDVNGSNETISTNSNFLQQLVTYMKWSKPSQQDAFDLLASLMQHVEKEFPKENKHCDLPLKIKILHEFQDKESSNTIETDLRDRKTIQKYLGLSLNLCGDYTYKPGVLLEFMIDKHFRHSKIDENKNKLARMSLFKKAPDVLLIHIQANKLDSTKSKLIKPEYHIKYTDKMTLFFHIVHSLEEVNSDLDMDREYNTQVTYDLKAIIEHYGKIECGHYVTHRKWNNEWYLMNDEKATPKKFDNNICPYIMIYERSSDQADNDSTDSDPADNNPGDNNRIDSDLTDNDQTANNQIDIDQTNSDRIESDPTDSNQIDSNSTESDPTESNRTESNPTDSNQIDRNQINSDRTESDRSEINPTDRNRIDSSQINSDRIDRDQTG